MAQQYIGTAKWATHQSVAYTGTAGTIANGVSTGVYKVRIVVTTAAYIKVSSAGTAATSSDVYMAADSPEYVTVYPGQKVSAIQVSASGTLHVTECE